MVVSVGVSGSLMFGCVVFCFFSHLSLRFACGSVRDSHCLSRVRLEARNACVGV